MLGTIDRWPPRQAEWIQAEHGKHLLLLSILWWISLHFHVSSPSPNFYSLLTWALISLTYLPHTLKLEWYFSKHICDHVIPTSLKPFHGFMWFLQQRAGIKLLTCNRRFCTVWFQPLQFHFATLSPMIFVLVHSIVFTMF